MYFPFLKMPINVINFSSLFGVSDATELRKKHSDARIRNMIRDSLKHGFNFGVMQCYAEQDFLAERLRDAMYQGDYAFAKTVKANAWTDTLDDEPMVLPMLREMGCSYFGADGFKNLGFYDEKAQELISYPRFMFELSALIVIHSFAQEAYYNHRVASYSLMETHVKRALTNLLNSSDFETVTNIDLSVQCSQTGVLIETNLENRLLSYQFSIVRPDKTARALQVNNMPYLDGVFGTYRTTIPLTGDFL